MNLVYNVVFLSLALHASAQVPSKCGAPPSSYPHMQIEDMKPKKGISSHVQKVLYRCAEGYTQNSGIRSIKCQDGKWTQLTMTCEKKNCGSAGELFNGYFQYMGSFYGDKANAVCNEGFTLKGMEYRICKDSGWSGEIPTCEEGGEAQVVPAEVTCPAPSVANGVKLSETVSVYRVRDSVTLVCSEGFLLTGAQQLTCGPDGQWQPKLPLCLPFNDIIESPKPDGRCGVPPYHSNAHLSDCCRAQADFGPGHRVRYSCALGYMRGRGTYYSTCVSGRWTPVTLRCKRKSCGSAGEMSFGHFVYTGAQFGDTATGVCNEGYQLVGQNVRNCMNDGWDGRVPVCEAVQCAKLPEVVNGEINGHLEPPYVYSTVIGYRCRVGKLIGTSELYCTKDGTWSAPPPECKDIKCPYPKVQYAQMTRGIRMPLEFGDSVTFVCFRGMVMNGPGTVTCSLDGTWTPALPTCQYRRY
ncbi:complement receptor type 2-like isoform X2 [Oncorhynchus keta]|uniref:complement receptor type 2-like isoform X2 n=1 Tax=Oncorhynchus keta TaxID=8018 RepID=UPI00227D4964|nr:complement receptor type 2-like isoform X2 [Oncorhynchus keta]